MLEHLNAVSTAKRLANMVNALQTAHVDRFLTRLSRNYTIRTLENEKRSTKLRNKNVNGT